MNRKQIWLALALGLVLALLCAGFAMADSALKYGMDLSSETFTEPKTITVSFTVTNTADTETPGPVALYYPDGVQITEFGEPVLGAGESKNWSGSWTVTQGELDAGKISFMVRFYEPGENGELKEKMIAVSKRIQVKGGEPAIGVTRTIMPQTAQEGQEVSIIYEITNTGTVDVTGVTIKENTAISKSSGSVGAIAAGETAKYTFTAKMGKKDLTSQATITYKAGGKTYTAKADAAVIKYGKVNLTATLSADKKGGTPGETVRLTLKLKNSGKTDITDITVTDETLGTVADGETVPAGKTVTIEKEITITEKMDLLFTVRGNSGAGQIETATGKVSIIATDPTQEVALDVTIEPDRDVVYTIPDDVRFKVTVTNNGGADAKNVAVKAVDVTLYTFDLIPAGESRSFTRETAIQMAGTFQFTANVKGQLGETLSFPSNAVAIQLTDKPAAPTPTPVVLPEKPALVTVPPEPTAITAPPQPETVATPQEPAAMTIPPEPEAGTGTDEEIAKVRQEWEDQAAEIERLNQEAHTAWEEQVAGIEEQNRQNLADWEAQTAEIEKQNQEAAADWEAQAATIGEQNQANLAAWEAEKEAILNATPAPAVRPEAAPAGWDVIDLTDFPMENTTAEQKTRAELMNNGMLLINEWHVRPADFDESGIVSVGKHLGGNTKVQVDNYNISLFPVASEALLEAINAAKEEGLSHFIVTEGYRSWETQNKYFENKKQKLAGKYTNEEDLIAAAKKEVSAPGTSEFNSGLAFTLRLYEKGNSEINSAKYSTTAQAAWMNENCWKYGLIFRFPLEGWPLPTSLNKSYVTGISVQLNLYRYVGKGNAAAMHTLDLCLEEYIEYLHEHPHIAVYEDGVLKYEIVAQYVGDAYDFMVDVTPTTHVSSLDNMGYVITVFEY